MIRIVQERLQHLVLMNVEGYENAANARRVACNIRAETLTIAELVGLCGLAQCCASQCLGLGAKAAKRLNKTPKTKT